MNLNFKVLPGKFAVYKFQKETPLTSWIYSSDFYSLTKTRDELSVIAVQNDDLPSDVSSSKNWRIIKIEGPLDFSLIGIIAGITEILKENGISLLTVSTYSTDYILVKQKDLYSALEALKQHGHHILE